MKFNLNTISSLKHHLIICLFLIILLIMGMFITKSIINGTIDYNIKYISVKIEKGDTLWDLSEEYGNTKAISTKKYIEKLYNINGIKNSSIKSGDCIIFPRIILKD